MTRSLRSAALVAGRASGVFGVVRWWHRRDLTALTYHGVVDIDERLLGQAPYVYRNCVTVDQFREHVRFLIRRYHLLDGGELARALATGKMPPYAAVLTFDDGLRCQFSVAGPVLQELEAPAFFFLPTALVDRASAGLCQLHWTERLGALLTLAYANGSRLPGFRGTVAEVASRIENDLISLVPEARDSRLEQIAARLGVTIDPRSFPADRSGGSILQTMTWEAARALSSAGMEIGSHTATHANLASLDEASTDAELRESASRIKAETGRPCRFFALPYGHARHIGPAQKGILQSAGYIAAFTQIPGVNGPNTPPLELHRIDIAGNCDLPRFAYYTSGARLFLREAVA